MKIFDCFIFFDEKDLAELRINILKNYVDYFVVCEAKQNHRGQPKNSIFQFINLKILKTK